MNEYATTTTYMYISNSINSNIHSDPTSLMLANVKCVTDALIKNEILLFLD